MPKFKLLVDVDSVVDEAEHLEEIFKDGFDCSEEEAERIVSAKVKELMYGGPYYSIVEADDDEEEPASDNFFPDATDHHLIKPNLKKMTGGK
tara:strand:- start:2094 stop:2369 length:276 start_codon:yes stop_codon:yes gene_type:complete